MPGSITIADSNNVSAVSTDSSGAPAVSAVSEDKYGFGDSLNKGIENLGSTSTASREWVAGDRPEKIWVEAKPSSAAELAIATANARVNLVFDAATDAIGEALAAPAVGSGILPYTEISLNTEYEFTFPKTSSYDGLSRISAYSNGVAVDILIRGVK